MEPCPNFACLRYTADQCDTYPACDGCPTQGDCSVCSNQEEIVEGGSLPCFLRKLPPACRSCSHVSQDRFPGVPWCKFCGARL